MNDLHGELAPISEEAWGLIEEQARRTLKLDLAARRIVDFSGPHGWKHAAVATGRVSVLGEGPRAGVDARLRRVQPLLELRTRFELSREELEAVGRGAPDPDLDPVVAAARAAALAEDSAVFHGFGPGGIRGICEASTHEPLAITDDYEAFASTVAIGLSALRNAGVDGPYALALGSRSYTGLQKTIGRHGVPLLSQVTRMLDGPVVWAPALDGAVLLSARGQDFELTVGQDLSIGYLEHDAVRVALYLQESITFRVLTPEAALALRYG
jgi:uncharacterized linocin/CFP29 family protein